MSGVRLTDEFKGPCMTTEMSLMVSVSLRDAVMAAGQACMVIFHVQLAGLWSRLRDGGGLEMLFLSHNSAILKSKRTIFLTKNTP